MDGSGGHHAKLNKSDKDKCCIISYTCGIQNKTKRVTELIDTERLVVARGWQKGYKRVGSKGTNF